MTPTVYILSNKKKGTLYIGVTSNLIQRVWQHKEGVVQGFTRKYNIHSLVYYEQHETMESAIYREKQLKKWNRQWKLNLVHENNPEWVDLFASLV